MRDSVPRRRPRVIVLGLGGTIARRRTGVDFGRRSVTELLQHVPRELAELEAHDITSVGSSGLSLEDLAQLARTVRAAIDDGCDGVVVTQGTDTIAETAYALSMLVEPEVPIALTGAMRVADQLGADGPSNILDAVRVAASQEASVLGPVVVIGNEIHLARWATKVRTSGLRAIDSPGFGPVGAVIEERVHVWARPTRPDFVGMPANLAARVEVVWVTLGMDDTVLKVATSTADGIVIAGAGGGHVPPSIVPSLQQALDKDLPVILASRTLAGPILEKTYAGPGTEIDLLEMGLVSAGMLSSSKARLRLVLALALDLSATDVFPV
jgi:L-asparaginase